MNGSVSTFRIRALSDALVYEIAKDEIAPILKDRPVIAAELRRIMLRREAAKRAPLNARIIRRNLTRSG